MFAQTHSYERGKTPPPSTRDSRAYEDVLRRQHIQQQQADLARQAAEDHRIRTTTTTWHTADKRFTVTARFELFADGKVLLVVSPPMEEVLARTVDPRIITVNPSKLCTADRNWIRDELKRRKDLDPEVEKLARAARALEHTVAIVTAQDHMPASHMPGKWDGTPTATLISTMNQPQLHTLEVVECPERWMPWNYLDALASCEDAQKSS